MSELFRIRTTPELAHMTSRQLAQRCHEVEGVDDVVFLQIMDEVERRDRLYGPGGGMALFMEHYRDLWPAHHAAQAASPPSP